MIGENGDRDRGGPVGSVICPGVGGYIGGSIGSGGYGAGAVEGNEAARKYCDEMKEWCVKGGAKPPKPMFTIGLWVGDLWPGDS